jgi:hypothetical protein
MLASKTLLVVGAGASKEVNLPIGPELSKDIASRLDIRVDITGKQTHGDPELLHAIRTMPEVDVNAYATKACWAIRDGMWVSPSIDNFLHVHQADEAVVKCGKLAIVRSILEAERRSKLYVAEPHKAALAERLARVDDTWLIRFFKKLGELQMDPDRLFERLSVICFNYDRCIEAFLADAIQALYRVDEAAAQRALAGLKIFHPYGYIGPLGEVPFGGHQRRPDLLVKYAENIRTFTERVEEGAELAATRAEVAAADTIVFLGFAFHPQNLKLLSPGRDTVAWKVFATAYGISDADSRVIQNEIGAVLSGPTASVREMYFRKLRCAELFDEFSRSL